MNTNMLQQENERKIPKCMPRQIQSANLILPNVKLPNAELQNIDLPNVESYGTSKVNKRQKYTLWTSSKETWAAETLLVYSECTAAYMQGLYNTVRVQVAFAVYGGTTAIRNMPPQLFNKSTSLDVTLVLVQSDIFLHCPALLCDFIICTLGKIK